jgi:putative transposase
MPRIARVVATDLPHHVTQRGNNRTEVFCDDKDREFYLRTLAHYCRECSVDVWAYCLMRNHVHLLVVPREEHSLARGIGRTNLVYTQYINGKYKRTGRLWQNRFYSCVVDKQKYLWAVVRYIERNPVRARLSERPESYRWSSAMSHLEGKTDFILSDTDWLGRADRREYRLFLNAQNREEEARIKRATASGRPLGSDEFVSMLERNLGRVLRPRQPGRPRKRD